MAQTAAALDVVSRALRPQIAVCSSSDVDDLARSNGLSNLAQLLKPWEKSVERVTVRNSSFVAQTLPSLPLLIDDFRDLVHTELDALFLDSLTTSIDKRTPEWLQSMPVLDLSEGGDSELWQEGSIDELTPWYAHYRESLVNRRPSTAYETFGHPVACMIAVSTSNSEPMNAFGELYDQTSPPNLFADRPYMDPHILRYYVLVHDLSTGPAEEWTGLLDNVRKAYGVHCAMLLLNAEIASIPDSAYTSEDQRPPPKSTDFAEHWRSLPTSPTVPSFRTFSSAADIHSATPALSESGAQEPVAEPGKNLGEEDLRQIKAFLREFVVQSLVPHMERTISTLNDQLASTRRGIAGRLFSAGRRYFGSRPGTPANAAAQSAYDPVKNIYPYASQEAQTRRLADMAFMFSDFKLALSLYEIIRKDFLNDKAWRYYASATRMSGLTTLLLYARTGEGQADVDLYLEQAAASSPPDNTQLDDLRAICLCHELYQASGQWSQSASALTRAASDIEELPSALMLEQAAMSMLKARKAAKRRAALQFIVASHRYQTTGAKALARRCGQQALSIFPPGNLDVWQASRRYLDYTLGRQAYNNGHSEQALQHFAKLLAVYSASYDPEDRSDDQSFLYDLELAWKALGENAEATAQSSAFTLPLQIVDGKATRIILPHAGDIDCIDSKAWEALEDDFLNYGYPHTAPDGTTRSRPMQLLDTNAMQTVSIGSTFDIQLTLHNGLNTPVTLTELSLLWQSNDGQDCVSIETPGDIQLQALCKASIRLKAIATREGNTSLEGVSFRLNGTVRCIENLKKRGPRLNSSKAHFETPTYAEDRSLDLQVRGEDVALVARVERFLSSILTGEIIHTSIIFINNGSRPVYNLRILCSSPRTVEHLVEGALAKDAVSTASGLLEMPNSLVASRPDEILASLQPGESYTLPVALRVAEKGEHSVGWLAVFESETSPRTMRFAYTIHAKLGLQASLSFVNPDDTTCELRISAAAPQVDLVDILSLSPAWTLKGQVDGRLLLTAGQTSSIPLQISHSPDCLQPDFWQATQSQLEDLLAGNDPAPRQPAPVQLRIAHILGAAEDTATNVPEALHHIIAQRSHSRVTNLIKQVPKLEKKTLRSIFPLFTPNAMDVLIFWRIPSSGSHGFFHLTDMSLGPSDAHIDAILRKAGESRSTGRFAETQDERDALIASFAKSELGSGICPVTIEQFVKSGMTTFKLLNRSSRPVKCRLKLLSPLGNAELQCESQPVQWYGKAIQTITLQSYDSATLSAKYRSNSPFDDAGAWILETQQEHSFWSTFGKEALAT